MGKTPENMKLERAKKTRTIDEDLGVAVLHANPDGDLGKSSPSKMKHSKGHDACHQDGFVAPVRSAK